VASITPTKQQIQMTTWSSLENPTGYLKLNFMKTRKESYYMEVRPTADSSIYVDVTLNVYYRGELIKTESNGGYNQPSVIAAGNLND
jgi:hypothetical protein